MMKNLKYFIIRNVLFFYNNFNKIQVIISALKK